MAPATNGYYSMRDIRGPKKKPTELPRPVSRQESGELVINGNQVRLMMAHAIAQPRTHTSQIEWMHRLSKEEHMTRAEAASLWTAWQQTLRESLAALGPPEGARALVVGCGGGGKGPPIEELRCGAAKGD